MVVLFVVLWGIYTLFSLVAVQVHVPMNSVGDFTFLHIFTNSYLLSFLIAILRDVRWYLTVIFTCIPLMMASDAEHFSMSLLAIWIFSLGKKIYPDPLSSFLSACLWTSLMAQLVKCLSTMRKTWVPSLGQEDSLEKEMATNSSTLAWKIPWMEESGGLQSMG